MLWLLQFTWICILICGLAYKFLKESNGDFNSDSTKSEIICGALFIQKLEMPFLYLDIFNVFMQCFAIFSVQVSILLLNLLPSNFLCYATVSRVFFLVSFLDSYSQQREMQLILVYLYHILQTCGNCLLALTGAWIP